MFRREDAKELNALIEQFPGATYSVVPAKRHDKFVFRYRGETFNIFRSRTPSCTHAGDNFLADVKRKLREISNAPCDARSGDVGIEAR